MTLYEIMYITASDVENVEAAQKKAEAILLKHQGKIETQNNIGLLKFAYPINKKNEGVYKILTIRCLPSNIVDFKKYVGVSKDLIRTLVLNTDKENNYKPSTKLSATPIVEEHFVRRSGRRYKRRYVAKAPNSTNNSSTVNTYSDQPRNNTKDEGTSK